MQEQRQAAVVFMAAAVVFKCERIKMNGSRAPVNPWSRREAICSPYIPLMTWSAISHRNLDINQRGSPASRHSCPFRIEGLWEYGETIRSSTLEVEFVGVTGNVAFTAGETLVSNSAGAAGSGWREANGTTFCALNLQAHASLGATFAAMFSWQPKYISDTTGTTGPFQVGRRWLA